VFFSNKINSNIQSRTGRTREFDQITKKACCFRTIVVMSKRTEQLWWNGRNWATGKVFEGMTFHCYHCKGELAFNGYKGNEKNYYCPDCKLLDEFYGKPETINTGIYLGYCTFCNNMGPINFTCPFCLGDQIESLEHDKYYYGKPKSNVSIWLRYYNNRVFFNMDHRYRMQLNN
jgi:hypothetical protein